MFVSNLNKKQQEILIALSEKIVAADGEIHSDEKKMLDVLIAQCVPGIERIDVDIANIAVEFETHQAKSSLMLELIGVAFSDADYDLSEKEIINNVADVLQLDSLTINDMESWVSRQLMLVQEANAFMEGA